MKKYIDLEDMVNVNCSTVLDIIQKNRVVSRKEITDISGLSWGGMTKIVNKLLENGYIVEEKLEKSTASGRIPSVLSINTKKNFVIGLDINNLGLNAIVTDLTGEILDSFSAPTVIKDSESFLREILDFISDILGRFDNGSVISIGIAMQGIVDSKSGISVKFPHLSDWKNVAIKQIIEDKFKLNVFVEHDPDCLLYPHINYGKKENIVLLRIDKSIGMAIALEDKTIKGQGIFEIAHNTVILGGKRCHCGQSGCIEAYIAPCTDKDGKTDLQKLAELITPLAITVKNMSGIFYADKVILTGKLMEEFSPCSEAFAKALKNIGCNTKIEFSDVSDFAVRGAALIAINKSINSLLI